MANPTGTPVQQDGAANFGVTARLAAKYGVDARKLMQILRDSTFRVKANEPPFTDAEIAAALILADQYGLNPFTNEIYVVRDKDGRMLRMVSVDGWLRIVNGQKNYDGFEGEFTIDQDGKLVSYTCRMFRKDRSRPTIVTVLFKEWNRPGVPRWEAQPSLMLMHKGFKLAARYAFSLTGIDDDDEVEPAPVAALGAQMLGAGLPRMIEGQAQMGAGQFANIPPAREEVPATEPPPAEAPKARKREPGED